MMSEVNRDKLFERAVDMVIKEGEYVETWAGRLVTVHAGLATAVGLVVSWNASAFLLRNLSAAIVVLLAGIAVVLSVLMERIIRWHLAWQAAYVESVKQIEGNASLLFRKDMLANPCSHRVGRLFTVITVVLCVAWLTVAVLAFIL